MLRSKHTKRAALLSALLTSVSGCASPMSNGVVSTAKLFNPADKGAIVTEAQPANFAVAPAAQVSSAVLPAIPTTGIPNRISSEELINARDQHGAPGQVALTGGRPIVAGEPVVVVASNDPFANFQVKEVDEVEVVKQIPPATKLESSNPAAVKTTVTPKVAEPMAINDDEVAKAAAALQRAEEEKSAKAAESVKAEKRAKEKAKEKAEAEEKDAEEESLPNPNDSSLFDSAETPSYVGTQPLSLSEAVRVALSQNKSITVLGYLPQEVNTFVSSERAVFDPVFNAGIRGGQLNRQYRNFINTGGVLPGGFTPGANEQRNDFLGAPNQNVLSITKLLETGGTISAGLGMDYLYDTPVGNFTFLNPAWGTDINLSLIQPLGKGRGRNVTTAPLRIARTNQSLAAHEFQAEVNKTLRDVQNAYWDWKLAQRAHKVTQDAVQTALKTLELEKEALKLGEGTLPDFEQANDQWQRFRIDDALALNAVKKTRITLIQLMGLPLSQIEYDFAIDEPNVSADIQREIGDMSAMSRPEVLAAQANIRATQLAVILAADTLRPDLNLRVDYAVTGLESALDEAIETVSEHRFNDWVVQLEFTRAVGQRAACAALRRAQLQLARAIAEQDRVEQEIAAEVARTWEDVITSIEQLRIQTERVETARAQVKGRNELFSEGEGSLDLKIRAEASLIDSLLKKQAAEIAVQQQIVQWRYVTGQQQFVQFTE
ncbi:Outer membrane efflux protein [Rubripirellula reticaptiva]|uniref:Outer membrane efflux protein n=2 Tax=Rubripirellula reticaptiva TaxID=2528013 RepID=A0A5C6F935_9BACT|nr:Outer membrane efflux protein [Rubripirellula reticaptiva]